MVDEILKLKKEKGYIILAHNYQIPELQDIADFVGDSLQLARKAMELSEKKILFLGVDFMAELVKILNPDKKVIVPDRSATCPMANHLTPEIIREYREKFPDVPVVLYVNSTSECKALADVICTSANAVEVVKNWIPVWSSLVRIEILESTSRKKRERRSSRYPRMATAQFISSTLNPSTL